MTEMEKEKLKENERKRIADRRRNMTEMEKGKSKESDRKRKADEKSTMTEVDKDKLKDNKKANKVKRRKAVLKEHEAIEEYKHEAKKGPVYTCLSCLRLLHKQSVLKLNDSIFEIWKDYLTQEFPFEEFHVIREVQTATEDETLTNKKPIIENMQTEHKASHKDESM
ncbi:hypothetical protein DPMN_090781 [Dreissena polymorpha]|uniref:Uncharacterized protein n=1 Tax=Dreissena polymorpha TaxID=45954 RepID=A0A9D4KZD7_DREPO|nr:hypothetical protein DPMN_090781 [Dreissena polymorpha]